MNDVSEDDLDAIRTEEPVTRNWQAFFWVAAVFNLIIGLSGMLVPEVTIDGRTIGLLTFGLGIVYFQVARDPVRFGPVLWAGILAKVGVVALLSPQVFSDPISPMLAGVLIFYGLFALGFLTFLLTVVDDYEL